MADELTGEALEGAAMATGNVVDRVQRMRNKLVKLAQDGKDEDRQWAVLQLQDLTKKYGGSLSSAGQGPPTDMGTQTDPNPSPPLTGVMKPFAAMGSDPLSPGNYETTTDPGLLDEAGNGLVSLINSPGRLADPRYRRQMETEFDKGATGGIGAKLIGGEDWQQGMEQYARERPLTGGERALAKGAGLMAGIPRVAAAKVGQFATSAMPGFLSRFPILGGAAVGAAGGGVGAGTQAAAETATSSTAPWRDRIPEAAAAGWKAAKDPVNLALSAVGGAASGGAAKMRGNNPDVQFIEARGGRVGPTTPGAGGAMDDPLVQGGISPQTGRVTEAGKGKVAGDAAEGITHALGGRAARLGNEHRARLRTVNSSSAGGQLQDITDLYDELLTQANNPRLFRGERASIRGEFIDDFINTHASLDDANGATRVMMPASRVNELKQKLQEASGFVPTGKPGAADGTFAPLAHDAARNVGEDIGGINRIYKQGADEIEGARAAVGAPGEASDRFSDTQKEAIATRIGRRGADTRTAGRDVRDVREQALQDAADMFPEIRRYIEAPELLQHRSNLEFGTSNVGGLMEKNKLQSMVNIIMRNWAPAKVRLISPFLESLGATMRAAAPANEEIETVIDSFGERPRQRMDSR